VAEQHSKLVPTEAALQESEATYRRLFENAEVGMFRTRIDGSGVLAVNRKMSEIFEYTKQEFLDGRGKDFWANPQLRTELTQTIAKTGSLKDCEIEFRTRSGKIKTCLLSATFSADEGVMEGSVVDLSTRKETEAALARSEEKYRTFFHRAPIALFRSEAGTGKILDINDEATKLMGLTRAEALATPGANFWFTDDGRARMLERLKNEKSVDNVEANLKMAEDKAIVALMSIRLYAEEGLLEGSVVDITELRKMQQSLAQKDRLAHLGFLSACIGHEINTPLTYLLFNLEKLQILYAEDGTDSNPETRALVDKALDAVERIRGISERLHGFTRGQSPGSEAVSINDAIENALEMVSQQCEQVCTVSIDLGALPPVWGNRGQLSQVFLNLLSNACHALHESNKATNRIEVRTWAEGERVLAHVSDTGQGIPPEKQHSVFEPFYRAAPIDDDRGTGLGLSICKMLVEAHKGTIEVQSNEGEGSTFIVSFPADLARTTTTTPPQETAVNAHTIPRHGRLRMLVVDDERDFCEFVCEVFEKEDIQFVESGAAAQTLLNADQNFDLIICDLMMKDITGMELHTWLLGHYPELARRSTFVTGGAFSNEARDFQEKANNPMLFKPFSIKELECFVGDAVERLSLDRS
jgi:PAS domain S-box-containing protein